MDMEVDANDADLQAWEELSNLLTELNEKPLSYQLHYKHLKLAPRLGDPNQLVEAWQLLTGSLAATDDVWLPYLRSQIAALDQAADIEPFQKLEALFVEAENDYLSIPILQLHLDFLLKETDQDTASSRADVVGHGELYSAEAVSERAKVVVEKAVVDISKGHLIWDRWMEWEQDRLQATTGDDRDNFRLVLQAAYMVRLGQCHLSHAQTFQNYSQFVSTFFDAEKYEESLVHATKVRQKTLDAANEREPHEASLTSLNAWNDYLTWEATPRPGKPVRGARRTAKPKPIQPDPVLVKGLYERAIALAASQRATAVMADDGSPECAGAIAAAEAWLAAFWDGLISFLVDSAKEEPEDLDATARSVRSVPTSGPLIASRIRSLDFHHAKAIEEGNEEHSADLSQKISDVYQLSISSDLLEASAIVDVTTARAAFENRKLDPKHIDSDVAEALKLVLDVGIAKSRAKGGEASLKMEKFLVYLLDLQGLDVAVQEVWEDTAKFHKNNYLVWMDYASYYVNKGLHKEARTIFKNACNPSRNIDYPQPIWNAWILFEEMHGTPQDVQHTLKRVKKMTLDFSKKAAEAAAQEAAAYVHTNDAAAVANSVITDAVAAASSAPPLEAPTSGIDAMSVDVPEEASRSAQKRKAEDEEESVDLPSKKAKPDDAAPLKRDRENSTVFVAALPKGVEEEELQKIFKDCGSVREIKIVALDGGEVVATVEFMDTESVPMALTKDKKRIQGQEIAVFMAYKSTLFVTNFPEKADDAFIRNLFKEYGTIFDVRWPSKKLKSTRRFVYVQYTSPKSANNASGSLNGFQVEEGFNMSVLLSNPSRKKERTDARVDQREIYVAGLARSTTERELRELFAECGAIKAVRLPLDEHNKAKGFGFVEFEHETSASKALALNNKEVKKRRIAVTMVDPRAPGRKQQLNTGLAKSADLLSRTVRIKGLPEGSEEGLLQQAIDRVASNVSRVEIFRETWEAIVEFKTMADAAKLLLTRDGLTFQGTKLQLIDESQLKPAPAAVKKDTGSNGPTAFVPRAAAKPKARVAVKPTTAPVPKAAAPTANGPSAAGASSSAPKKDQDAFRAMLG